MQTERLTIALTDGRTVEVLALGPPGGLPLVVHHGTPGGGLVHYEPKTEVAVSRGLRVIHFARPGYSRSSPRLGRRVANVADDVAEILDALGAETFITHGTSGGGPHALACAYLLPGRCLAAASIAGVAPRDAAGLDWAAGMGPENIEEFGAAESSPADLTAFLEKAAAELGAVTGGDIITGLGGLIDDADKAVLTGEYADYQAAALRAAVARSIVGWYEDDMAFVSDWGFELGPGTSPVTGVPDPGGPPAPIAVWQGDQDRMVPFSHGQWLAAHLPGARVHLLPGEGHISLEVNHYDAILTDLLDMAGIRS
ncbi:MAG TPA: alpha/beta fold hydrolase [Streptosporangiaceae bacterium]|jgi:pimeloyl-ACP methyl ester carboxylesterase|nr:alpha/beta fold hydrolase [Streptosporangiaceae bacterium]